MTISQLSVFVENRPGALVEITETLGKADVDIRAMSIADTQEFGILRFIVNDMEKAQKALTENGCVFSVTPVIAVAVSDKPGALISTMQMLSQNGINVEYMYAFITVSKEGAYVVLRVEDNDRAIALLKENNVPLVTDKDMQNL